MTDETVRPNGHDQSTDSQELNPRALRMARETLTGDIRDIMLNDMKDRANAGLAWNLRSEKEQESIIDQCNRMAEAIVERCCQIVAANGRKTIKAVLGKVTIGEKAIKAELGIAKTDEQRLELFDSVGAYVDVIVVEPHHFTGERAPVTINKQQQEMFPPAESKDGDPKSGDPAQPSG